MAPAIRNAKRSSRAHCYDCHDDLTAKGRLDLTILPTNLTNPDTLAKWTLIHDRVRNGEMPPEDKPQPKSEERDRFVTGLSQQLLAAERQIDAERGKGVVRRMNRTEYEHTLQDLLSLPLLRVKEMLPEDGQQHGFDERLSCRTFGFASISKQPMLRWLRPSSICRKSRKPWFGAAAAEQGTGRRQLRFTPQRRFAMANWRRS